jgi:hypothetical protein
MFIGSTSFVFFGVDVSHNVLSGSPISEENGRKETARRLESPIPLTVFLNGDMLGI